MRWFSYLLVVAIISVLPLASFADEPTADEIRSGETGEDEPTTSGPSTGVDFDIGDNVLGNPDNNGKVSSGTLESITFLSGGSDPVSIVINIINLSLSFLGLLSLLMILYAGVTWFMAGDNEEEITKAKDIIKGAVIGLVITMSAMGIAQLVFNNTVTKTTVQTSWLDHLILPAYAQEEQPKYEPEELPFDLFTGSASENTTLSEGGLGMATIASVDLGTADPVTVTYAVVNGLLTLLAFGFMILMIYAGVTWVLARGNEEQITKAKTILKRAVIGLIIVLSSYGVAALTFRFLDNYTIL